jgi:hypothetical protein
MNESQILAVDHVELESVPGVEEPLTWLYRDLAGLELIDPGSGHPVQIRFGSGPIELRYTLRDEPRLSPIQCRLVVEVASLEAAELELQERNIRYTPLHGITHTDQRLGLRDPGGNRVELKQRWPARF